MDEHVEGVEQFFVAPRQDSSAVPRGVQEHTREPAEGHSSASGGC